MDSVLQHLVLVGTIEGWVTTEHLIYQGAETPPIHTLIMSRTGHYFWSHVFWCTTKRVGTGVALIDTLLRQSKIGHLKVAISIQKNVLRFEVAIYDTIGMKTLQSAN